MRGVICGRDYYDKNGILIIARGVEISPQKLRQLEREYETKNRILSLRNEKSAGNQFRKLKRSDVHGNVQTLNTAGDLLVRVMFEARRNPWREHISALNGYIDWLYTHSVDVALISLMIAVELGHPDSILMKIGLGAVLHDIGKLLIPKGILLKNGELSREEETILRQHCELGWRYVSDCSLSSVCRDIILQHHERLDGSGYPQQLHRERISRYAKIVMVADSFAGLTTGVGCKDPEAAFSALWEQREAYSKECLEALEAILRRTVK
ncbi:HD domain-containing phosphohydrolase [Lachnospiraceae bacterium 54-53]